jgi:hypothetical protein
MASFEADMMGDDVDGDGDCGSNSSNSSNNNNVKRPSWALEYTEL